MEKTKKALIIGGSSGIGESLAYNLKEYQIYNISRTPCVLEDVINFASDVSKKEERDTAISALKLACDSLDLFVYSAGCSMSAPFEYTKEDNYRYLFEVNFFGCVEILKELLPLLKKANGQVIFISSLASAIPIPFDPFYSASKSALNSLATELNVELQPYGVKVVSAIVGGTKTAFTFKRLIYDLVSSGEYYGEVKKSADVLESIEQNGGDVNATAEKILELIGKKGTRAIGLKNKMALLVKNVISDDALICIIRKIFC